MIDSSASSIQADYVLASLGGAPRRTRRVRLRGPWGTRLRITRLVIATPSALRDENLCIIRANLVPVPALTGCSSDPNWAYRV